MAKRKKRLSMVTPKRNIRYIPDYEPEDDRSDSPLKKIVKAKRELKPGDRYPWETEQEPVVKGKYPVAYSKLSAKELKEQEIKRKKKKEQKKKEEQERYLATMREQKKRK